MKYYLAYGSNLNIEQMGWRCPSAIEMGTAELKGWRLAFKGSKTGSYLTIDRCKGHTAPVAIWGVGMADEYALDRYEGFPTFYYKKDFMVDFPNGRKHRCFAYIMRNDADYGIPSMEYVTTCMEGYSHFGFDGEILEEALEYSKMKRRVA